MAQQETPGHEPHAPSFGATITVLFSDIRGFTEYTDQSGDEAAYRMLQHHNAQLQEQIALYGGHIVKSLGDSYMVSYDSARMAVACAVGMQRAIEGYNKTEQGAKVEIGIGINTGEPVRDADDLFGGAVNLASRICAAAGPGQVLVSETVRHVVGRAEGVEWRDRGFFEIKGFADAQHLFEVEWSDRGVGRATSVAAPRAEAQPQAPLHASTAAVAAVAPPATAAPAMTPTAEQRRGLPLPKIAALVAAVLVVAVIGAGVVLGGRAEQQSGASDAGAVGGTVVQGGKLLRSDDFSDPARGLFQNNQKGTGRQTFNNGASAPYQWEYGYENGVLAARIKGPYPQNAERAFLGWSFLANDKVFEDFAVEFKARATKSPAQAQYSVSYVIDPGVIPNEQYVFGVQLDDKTVSIAHVSKEPRRQLSGGKNSAIKGGTEENLLRMEVRGDTLRAFINGVEAERAQHPGLAKRGGVLRMTIAMFGPPDDGEVEVRFDDFKVYSLQP